MIDLAFIAERYNYWIFIVLMMIGVYIVISRGNLVKKIVGLNIFQTSVFIYYISIGKVAGGTAPILPAAYESGHEGKGARASAAHGESAPAPGAASGESLHAAPQSAPEALPANDLASAVAQTPQGAGPSGEAGLHAAPGEAANPLLAPPDGAGDAASALGEAAHKAAEIVYSNPLPHVLILTAIVVGVATTAVGLALAVRIREAYGTIEEDELEAADDIAEFGAAFGEKAEGARA
ncbi:sodium:proton antiporter [Amphiplicatus metriothermophilus]|uniref:Multicomponent Na+:H+ antiporter subunit C n=1 Tax=Amphiplicatus metriothermophilus TaxID=1519374 RepID=A0A239PZV9_9PROT|nr:cation:proton antiporter subunit C [Amphiplicatus metriothermophilus]MBB5518253.1 multicomponent Na+:H+ antiporter subunit C [Amphiplicatus metriothermophilus]SNT75472.1 multicomponent Na+:H+ antiporter subunit C [Amphiplicatus metriothermophilus]